MNAADSDLLYHLDTYTVCFLTIKGQVHNFQIFHYTVNSQVPKFLLYQCYSVITWVIIIIIIVLFWLLLYYYYYKKHFV